MHKKFLIFASNTCRPHINQTEPNFNQGMIWKMWLFSGCADEISG